MSLARTKYQPQRDIIHAQRSNGFSVAMVVDCFGRFSRINNDSIDWQSRETTRKLTTEKRKRIRCDKRQWKN